MSVIQGFYHKVSIKLQNQKQAEGPETQFKLFSRRKPPPLNLLSYVERLQEMLSCPDEVFGLAYIYINKLLNSFPLLQLTPNNVHRLAFTSIVIAYKYSQDIPFKAKDFAKIGGVTCKELKDMESTMLEALDWKLYVQEVDTQLQLFREVVLVYSESSTEDESFEVPEHLEALQNEELSELSIFFTSN
uniref:Cyclin-like domain-containing protein n=1 Tax=Fabrea salina TaxID=342563 RepID=A0A7S3MSB4_9CILI|mmetsp:Transcript_259/g.463  ORF Transcript_259/g.463 Transcript_259/m.463 type:complete len:188 (+) Transcript_259:16-579(+)